MHVVLPLALGAAVIVPLFAALAWSSSRTDRRNDGSDGGGIPGESLGGGRDHYGGHGGHGDAGGHGDGGGH